MARVQTYFNFTVPEAWQDTTPAPSGIAPFTEWVLHVEAALRECLPLHSSERLNFAPGFVWTLPTYTVRFEETQANIYYEDTLLASWPVIYDDPTPTKPKPFSLRDQQARQRHR